MYFHSHKWTKFSLIYNFLPYQNDKYIMKKLFVISLLAFIFSCSGGDTPVKSSDNVVRQEETTENQGETIESKEGIIENQEDTMENQEETTPVIVETTTLPDIASFLTNPTNQFILDSEGLNKVAGAFPFKGSNSSCSHSGAHLHFTEVGAPYEVPLYAPVDGIIESVDHCTELATTDRFGIALAFANNNGETLVFYFSIEPAEKKYCSQGNPDFYSPYILVKTGQEVKKGDLLGYFPKFAGQTGSGPHLHFNLGDNNGHYCPNIFNSSVTTDFASVFGNETCGGTSLPETFCYQPVDGEDLVGL